MSKHGRQNTPGEGYTRKRWRNGVESLAFLLIFRSIALRLSLDKKECGSMVECSVAARCAWRLARGLCSGTGGPGGGGAGGSGSGCGGSGSGCGCGSGAGGSGSGQGGVGPGGSGCSIETSFLVNSGRALSALLETMPQGQCRPRQYVAANAKRSPAAPVCAHWGMSSSDDSRSAVALVRSMPQFKG